MCSFSVAARLAGISHVAIVVIGGVGCNRSAHVRADVLPIKPVIRKHKALRRFLGNCCLARSGQSLAANRCVARALPVTGMPGGGGMSLTVYTAPI